MDKKKERKQQMVISYWNSDFKLGKIVYSLSVMAPLLGITRATLRKRLIDGGGSWIHPPIILFWVEKKHILRSGLRNPVPPKRNQITPKNDEVPPIEAEPKSVIEPKVVIPVKKTKETSDSTKGEKGGSQSSDHEKVPTPPVLPEPVDPIVINGRSVPPIDSHTESLAQAAVRKQKEKEVAEKARRDALLI